jgi:hypothetical protein
VSLDTTNPPLPPNASQEKGGNLDVQTDAQTSNVPQLLELILIEMRITNELLAEGMALSQRPEEYRNDPEFSKVR